jgi:tetratricopeptide (TPR) repeat protein
LDLRAVGRDLEVQTVVTGTVTPRKDSFLLSVELVDVRDNSLLWSEHYDRKLDELQQTHSDIAQQICSKLGVQLSDRERKRLNKRYTDNSEAYLLYLEGMHWWQKWTEAGQRRAIECLDRAIELDPKNALAHSGRAMAYMGASYKFLNPKEGLLIAKQAAEQAMQLDDQLAEAHTALAVLKYHYDWDWVGAEREFKLALELNPRYAYAHNEYAWLLACVGRTNEAVEQSRRAEQLEPRSELIVADRAFILYFARRYDEVIPQAQSALALDPRHFVALDALSVVHVDRGEFAEALAVAERLRPFDDHRATAIRALVHARTGKRAEAVKNSEILAQTSSELHYAYELARVYVALGEHDEALNLLERAVEHRSPDVLYLKIEPAWDTLRSEQRFAVLLKKMNFPP